MFKNRAAVTQIVIVISAFIVGTALGHWMAAGKDQSKRTAAAEAIPQLASSPAGKSLLARSAPAASLSDLANPASTTPAPRKSLDEILKGRNSGNRTKELEEFARNLNSSEFGAALKKLRQMPEGQARDLASGLLVARWIETDPEAALQFAAQNRDFDYIASAVFQQMAADNLPSALARAQAITDPNSRYQALRGVLSFMADQDPMGALRLAGSLGPFPNNEPLSQVIYRQWSATDPQAAAAQAAQDQVGSGWRSPVGQVLRTWANQDPLAAIAWSTSQPDSEAQARDIGQIIRQWGRSDLAAAANWVNTVPTGSVRDAAAASLAFSIAATDPSAALGWAQSIADATQRENAMQRLTREIMYRNPSSGAAILQAAGVPQNLIPPAPAPNQGAGGWRGR
jgi:hypothetical protein